MGFLGFSLILLCMVEIGASQPATEPNEVEALNKMIDYWNLGTKLNFRIDPCAQNATWAADKANPRIACECNSNACHITHLKIYALDISGEIPSELFTLKELKDLNLGQNILSGIIPPEIGQLTKMEYLSVGINNFTGRVPSELGNLTKLLSLSIGSNNFDGPLPSELGKLTSLQQLYIDSSGVSGPIPLELSNLKSLQILWASDNLFTGKLPEFFGTFTDLTVLRLEGTMLEGPVPSNFGALTKLDDLRIGGLRMEDSSLDFVENLTSLSILSLRNCRVAGQIPEKLGTLSNLKILDLSFNKLTGQIPNSFQDFTSLQFLYLGNNNLSGALPSNIISRNLLALDVSFNSLSGNIPQNSAKVGLSMNVVGTSINANSLLDGKAAGMLHCLLGSTKCSEKVAATSFSIKCGGTKQTSASGIKFDDDTETLGAASLYSTSDHQWAGDRVLQDFNIQNEAGGSKRALVRTFEANVTNTVMDIHFFWAGRGTCCIPFQSTYGPLVSAIHVSQASDGIGSSGHNKGRAGKLVGITVGCAAGLVIISSAFYLWWTKDKPVHMRVHTDSPRKG
ncbi:hypothetical protein Acr_00g0081040 [Actinidia rufa]|uniref:non-specific serine/threonine protein kinase n=1 Tax=Actinidia rufa TaxID=165716 RepID=A0A7J0DW21_9ERIC|nr:hypothetical protein Acr_00g0081040 [Actinidia rufa]